MTVRRVQTRDVTVIGKIINDCAEYGLMLHRSPAYLYEHVRDFHLAEQDRRVVGVCGLSIVWADLAEVYALAVEQGARGRGVGKALVMACVEEARRLGIRKLMVLTYEDRFFAKLGFGVVDRQTLPLKVWSQCAGCFKNQDCDEIAMVRVLEDVPEVSANPPDQPATGYHPQDYGVPVTLGIRREGPSRRQRMNEPFPND